MTDKKPTLTPVKVVEFAKKPSEDEARVTEIMETLQQMRADGVVDGLIAITMTEEGSFNVMYGGALEPLSAIGLLEYAKTVLMQ